MALVKYNNNSLSAITTASSLPTGAMTLIKSQTASSSSDVTFVHGTSDVVLDSTYPIYKFVWINCHPGTDDAAGFRVNFRDGGSSYDATKTSTAFVSYHREDDSQATLTYRTQDDLAQSTGVQHLTGSDTVGGDNDQSISGEMYLFNPSSTTYVKHFMARSHFYSSHDFGMDFFVAGYCNVTAAIDAVQFKLTSGNFDQGVIRLYGIG